MPDENGAAKRHLEALARGPRFTGTAEAAAARAYCSGVLQSLDYRVSEQPFEYSAAVGAYGTPIGGATALVVIVAGAALPLGGRPVTALIVLLAGSVLLMLGGRWLARYGVLVFPALRRTGVNLEARRGTEPPLVWLVAHVDSKSQPIPLAGRAAGIVLLALAWVAAIVLAMNSWMHQPPERAWMFVITLATLGALPVLGSTVGRRSAGAVDNASGVATVLTAAAMLRPNMRIGVLVTDAEEMGLAGARAWCRGRPAGCALNCDGVDDAGPLTLMWTRPRSARIERAMSEGARRNGERLRVIPLVPGVLVDGLAFSDAGWEAVTLSRGSLATLRRIHTRRDDLARMGGEGLESASRTLAHAAAALTEPR